MSRVEVNVDLNRVEGDLELALVLEDGVVAEARAIGTTYRGFEQLLLGRAPRDAAVITPRVCGICGTAHLYAATLALEQAWDCQPPPNATRIRNLCLIAEGLQSDLRQTFLYFAPDLCRERYRGRPWFEAFSRDFEPFRGQFVLEALQASRKLVEIVALFGGQWPHSSYMLPGGVVSGPEPRKLLASESIIDEVTRWFERRVVGMPFEAWSALASSTDYLAQLEAGPHRDSALGVLSRACRDLGLHQLGKGTPHMFATGTWCEPEGWRAQGGAYLLPAGVFDAERGTVEPFDQAKVSEHVKYSWFRPTDGGRHPFDGETVPDFQPRAPPHSERYTWAKAPRYDDKVMQTGPLPEQLIAGDRLLLDFTRGEGAGAWLRQFARVRRIGLGLRAARRMLDELSAHLDGPHFVSPQKDKERDGQGFGLVMAARGALGHWVRIRDGVIEKYQIVTPTAWNASPRDSAGHPGHWEQSLVGLRVPDPDDPIEVGHVIRSHDPCLVCTVHLVGAGGRRTTFRP